MNILSDTLDDNVMSSVSSSSDCKPPLEKATYIGAGVDDF